MVRKYHKGVLIPSKSVRNGCTQVYSNAMRRCEELPLKARNYQLLPLLSFTKCLGRLASSTSAGFRHVYQSGSTNNLMSLQGYGEAIREYHRIYALSHIYPIETAQCRSYVSIFQSQDTHLCLADTILKIAMGDKGILVSGGLGQGRPSGKQVI